MGEVAVFSEDAIASPAAVTVDFLNRAELEDGYDS